MKITKTIGLAMTLLLQAWAAGAGEITTEQATVGKMPPPNPYRLYVSDVALSHIVDGRLFIIDGESLKYLGTLGTAFLGLMTLSPDRSEVYVATTYNSRLTHGERTDVVDIWDAQTLVHKGEIAIPPKHAQALPYKNTITTSPDGRFIFVQNATPASSVTVVDRKANKFASEVQTPGCWILLAAQSVANRFSTLCGDGTILTVTLDEQGKLLDQKRSDKFFDADKDPLFVQAENDGDRYFFVSFLGQIHSANLGGEQATFETPWSLLDATDQQQGWRPGGYQPLALQRETGRLYVTMHPDGKEGSHKNPALEIWAFDLKTRQRLQRIEGNNAVALAVSQGAKPLLFAIDPFKAAIVSYDAGPELSVRKRVDGFGAEPSLIVVH